MSAIIPFKNSKHLLGLIAFGCILVFLIGCTSKPEDKLKYYEQAKTLYAAKNYTAARDALKKTIEIDPDFAGGYANLGEVYLKLGQVSKAVDALEKAIDLKPDLTGVQLKLAFLNLLKKDMDRAEHLLDSAVKHRPENLSAKYMLAKIYQMRNDYQKSEQIYRQLLKGRHTPHTAQAYLSLASLLIKQGKCEQAEQYLQKAVKEHPQSIKTVVALCGFYMQNRAFEKAEHLLKRAR